MASPTATQAKASMHPDGDPARIYLATPKLVLPATLPEDGTLCCVRSSYSPSLTKGFCFQYLNKGAANAVFTIYPEAKPLADRPSPETPFLLVRNIKICEGQQRYSAELIGRKFVAGKVLRVPRGLPKTLRGEYILLSFHKFIKPLFSDAPITLNYDQMSSFSMDAYGNVTLATLRSKVGNFLDNLMNHEGILLFPSVTNKLRSLAEPDVFVGPPASSFTDSIWAIVLENMSPVSGRSITLEIKPKWLAQSRDAPPNAKRCRTCAMQILSPKERATYICPLRLLHGSMSDIRPWLHTRITNLLPAASPHEFLITQHLLTYIASGTGRFLLSHLAFLQSRLDPHGVLQQDCFNTQNEANFNLRAAMTLRDCSLFIKVEYDPVTSVPDSIVSKLGDLDFKAAEKTPDWADKERRLRETGAYTRDLEDDLGCWLSRDGN